MKKILLLVLLSLMFATVFSQSKIQVYFFEITEPIAPPATRKTEKAFREAMQNDADLILLHLNTFGGTLQDADKIRSLILDSEIPVYAWIEINAASAGALISIACDSIYMTKGSSIGAATVVNQTGEVQPDKYQSYMRSMMRATAEATQRNPDIAQAMVDPSISIPGIIDSGKVLTLTTSEAIALKMAQAEANTMEEVFQKAGIENYTLQKQQLSPIDGVIGFLLQPGISLLLIIIIIGALYMEFQSPGIGLPLVVAIIAALLFFAPLYLEGLASHWEILLFLTGLILIGVEIFVVPGFGIFGIAGIILGIIGLAFSLVGNIGWDFSPVDGSDLLQSFVVVLLSLIIAIPFCLWLGQKILSSRQMGISLFAEQKSEDGYTIAENEVQNLIGKQGITITILRPCGKIEIDGKIHDAISSVSFIEKGEQIEVIGYQNASVLVQKV